MAFTRWWWSLACLASALSGAACTRGAPESQREAPSANAASAPAPSASQEPRRKRARTVTARPAATPQVPPQLVACAGRSFYRITRKSLQAFEAALKIPPPQLRGSATARQLAEDEISEPLNLITLGTAPPSAVVIAKHNVFEYQPGQKQASATAPIPTPAPLVAWADPRDSGAFSVRVFGEQSVHHYQLGKGAKPERELAGFDQRLFAVLADAQPLYSTPAGLLRPPAKKLGPFPEPQGPATVLFADSSSNRYWAADALGNLGLWDSQQGKSPVFRAHVPGVVIDAAQEGARVAVLSMELKDQGYLPTVTIFSQDKQLAQLKLGPGMAHLGQPELDLCLISGRNWVVVGGRDWMQLLDWSPPRLLAEW